MSLEVGYFAPLGEEAHALPLSQGKCSGFDSRLACPGLASPFTPYY